MMCEGKDLFCRVVYFCITFSYDISRLLGLDGIYLGCSQQEKMLCLTCSDILNC